MNDEHKIFKLNRGIFWDVAPENIPDLIKNVPEISIPRIFHGGKKDFIDLYFLFGKLGGTDVVSNYLKVTKSETVHDVATKLSRVRGAMNNKTPMPQMLISFDEDALEKSFDQWISEIEKIGTN